MYLTYFLKHHLKLFVKFLALSNLQFVTQNVVLAPRLPLLVPFKFRFRPHFSLLMFADLEAEGLLRCISIASFWDSSLAC